MTRFVMAVSVGGSFTGLTVTVKVFVTAANPPPAVPPLSCTTTLMTALPLALVAGVRRKMAVVLPLV